MSTTRTPFDDEIEAAEASVRQAREAALALAKEAKLAAKEARRAEERFKTMDRKLRDRARYIVGGAMLDDIISGAATSTEGFLKRRLSEADYELVKQVIEIERSKPQSENLEVPKSENAASQ